MKGQATGGNTADTNERLKGKQNITHRTMSVKIKQEVKTAGVQD